MYPIRLMAGIEASNVASPRVFIGTGNSRPRAVLYQRLPDLALTKLHSPALTCSFNVFISFTFAPMRQRLRCGGGYEIRTHGTRRSSGFQDRRDKPLCQPSNDGGDGAIRTPEAPCEAYPASNRARSTTPPRLRIPPGDRLKSARVFFDLCGSGTWTRTKTNGVRIRRSTVKLFPTKCGGDAGIRTQGPPFEGRPLSKGVP